MTPRISTGEAAGELAQLAPDVETLAQRLAAVDYLVDEGLGTSIFLSLRLPQPLLLEGEAGVGKTEAARSLAMVLDTPLIRLQCYEGIDAAEALYEWNYPRQLLAIRMAEAGGQTLSEQDLFAREYLIRRPLLAALEHPGPRPAVLLIDEIDRADARFGCAEAARHRRGDRLAGGTGGAGRRAARPAGDRPDAGVGAQVRRGPGSGPRGRP